MNGEAWTWPGWGDVFPVIVAALIFAATVAGLAWTVGRIFRPWMRDAARAEADRVSAEVKALADKLATNDFPHLEDRIERRLNEAREDRAAMRAELAAMEGRIGKGLERVEGLIVAALNRPRPDADPDPPRR